jgi:RNA polymerase sigma-B factor
VALLGAIDRFDPDRGQSFVAFAIPTILGELKRYFRAVGWSTHVTRGAQELALRVDRASKELAARTGHAPRVKELATYLELDIDYVLAGLEASAAQYAVSLDAPAPSSKPGLPQLLGESLGDDDDGFGLVEAKLAMSSAIGRLPYLEREALRLRMEGSLKQIEIADQLGCSQMQVSRLLRRASATIRELTGQP